MHRVSSNLTVFFKFFLPTVWIVFFGTFTAAIFMTDNTQLAFLTTPVFRYSFLGAYLFFMAMIYFSVFQLKRVEMGADHFIVSNYFKTYRLRYDDIESVSIIPFFRLSIISFRLRAKSSFGKKITFLASTFLWKNFLSTHPESEALFRKLSGENI
jgi:hypothetical protein